VAARRSVTAALADLAPGDRVIVACSGGADSLALVATTAWSASRLGVEVSAVIVDHGLQQHSAEIAEEARHTCTLLGVSATVERVTVGTEGGLEAAAREARYTALRAAAEQASAQAVLLGHTREDQAETVLLRLARGSGARSLAAMSDRTGLWRRPFLRLPRADVRAVALEALEPLGRQAWEDPHNADPAFSRVRVRSLLAEWEAALGTGVVLGLSRSADLLRDDADALDAYADEAWQQCVSRDGVTWSADCVQLQGLRAAVRTRVIRRMALAAGSPGESIGVDQVRVLEALVIDWHGQGETRLPGGVRADRACGRLRVHAPSPALE